MKKEIWKDVVGYEGLYQVSNLGRVYSLPKEWASGNGNKLSHNGKILKQCVNNYGYLNVGLCFKGVSKTKAVHKLVTEAFLERSPCCYKMVVDHINNDQSDNRLENLQIITQRENVSKDKKNVTSNYTGVDWFKRDNKWRAGIKIDGKSRHLGYFTSELEASEAYQTVLNKNLKQSKL